jgi:HEPN superfamily RiboL-PSP-like protein
MSLAIFENFLQFAERSIAVKTNLPQEIDGAYFESALVSHGIVLLHSHMEACLRTAFETRCRRCVDPEIRSLALKVAKNEMGRIKISELKGTLSRFGEAYKQAFNDHLDNSGLADTDSGGSWNSVVVQRATIAHQGLPATCTLADLRLFYNDIRKVLGFFCNALGLDPTEVAGVSNLIITPQNPGVTPI